ncbi:MAG: Uma2 family endonuclease [Lachnospiraceae bacterium]|nr:Uma2 family endonuclease [Lachnospiraceae bacterium]MCM1240766.1 Uma2 family endonuclease [Lachnospiraceae bacterium]MCM1240819.1 Uma2 family endonuclease [Lachnospiraceae bacterium]
MPLLKTNPYTAEDYWNLPDGQRAELIDGQLYNMAPPNRIHQELSFAIARRFADYIDRRGGSCKVYPAPFAVNLNADDETYVEPDISVICDKSKLTDHGCSGAPDLIVEIVSPGSRRMDYNIKNGKYAEAGVREYWIVDPEKQRTTVYRYEEDAAPTILPFSQPIAAGIFADLSVHIGELLQTL